jgi:hypothetical protein
MKTHGRLSDLHHDRCLSLAMWNGVADLERAHVRRHEVITFYRSFLAAAGRPNLPQRLDGWNWHMFRIEPITENVPDGSSR